MRARRIRNTLGSPVEGGNFYNRDREQARLWDRLESDHVLLLAPRRVGKTSLLYRLETTAPSHNFLPIYLSVASHETELSFVRALAETLLRHQGIGAKVLARAKDLLERVDKLSVAKFSVELSASSWRELGDDLLDSLRTLDERYLIMIDELPIFVLNLLRIHDRERVRMFLNWFREARIDRELHRSLRWLVCGSVGLDTVTQRERLGDTINDFSIVRLGAFSREHAAAFLDALAHSYAVELSPETRGHILDRVGWLIPYHIQLLFSALRDLDASAPSIAAVERAYAELLDGSRKSYFDTWYQRLRDELGAEDEGHALALLELAALDPDGVPLRVVRELARSRGLEDHPMRYLLGVLRNDGYLIDEAGRWRFRSSLLRDYWRNQVLA